MVCRLRMKNVVFDKVRTNYTARAHRRGTFIFDTEVRFYDKNDQLHGYSVIVHFQPDTSRYFLHNMFRFDGEPQDRAQAIKSALQEAKENQARNTLSNKNLLDQDVLNDIIEHFVRHLAAFETWGINKNGYPYKRVKGVGRYIIYFQEPLNLEADE